MSLDTDTPERGSPAPLETGDLHGEKEENPQTDGSTARVTIPPHVQLKLTAPEARLLVTRFNQGGARSMAEADRYRLAVAIKVALPNYDQVALADMLLLPDGAPFYIVQTANSERKAPPKPKTFVALDAETDPGPREWLVDGLLEHGVITVVVASGGTGKSALAIHVALAVASGKSFANWRALAKRKVLIVASEDDIKEQTRRMLAAREMLEVSLDDHRGNVLTLGCNTGIALVCRNKDWEVTTTTLYDEIEKAIREQDIGLVIIDPFVETAPGFNENDNAEMALVITRLRSLIQGRKCALMLVHHASKSSRGDQHGARGASALVNACRLAVNLERMTAEDASRYGIQQPQRFVRVETTKANYTERGGAKWLEIIPVDLANGGVGVGLKISERLANDNNWALPYRRDIEELASSADWPVSFKANARDKDGKPRRLDVALADLRKLDGGTAQSAVRCAAAEGWIVEQQIRVKGKEREVWRPFC